MQEYLLLNKNVPRLSFVCDHNEFDEPEFQEKQWLSSMRPIGYRNLDVFPEQCKAPKHRAHIQELLRRYGCDDMEAFLKVTHALSLNDTLL